MSARTAVVRRDRDRRQKPASPCFVEPASAAIGGELSDGAVAVHGSVLFAVVGAEAPASGVGGRNAGREAAPCSVLAGRSPMRQRGTGVSANGCAGWRLDVAVLLRRLAIEAESDAAVATRRRGPGTGLARTPPVLSLWLPDQLDVDLEGDLLGDEQPAGLQQHVPGQAPVLAVDGAGVEDGTVVGPRVGGVTEVADIEVTGRVTPLIVSSPAMVARARPGGQRSRNVATG